MLRRRHAEADPCTAQDQSRRADEFRFNEAISFVVRCETQAEIDRYWDTLSTVPEAEACGWCKDRFGLSWQIVPRAMDRMMRCGDADACR
ncbi:VOC family protein [Thiocapsa sp.]|uniref:VOC family protein n=1 Tax=Thiocapsa sp. TaxID=2024551 RepID=UPI0025DADD62|nr:VOC family protein [Thiocapsa sp.]